MARGRQRGRSGFVKGSFGRIMIYTLLYKVLSFKMHVNFGGVFPFDPLFRTTEAHYERGEVK